MRNILCFALLVVGCMGEVWPSVSRPTADARDLDIGAYAGGGGGGRVDGDSKDRGVYDESQDMRTYEGSQNNAVYEDMQSGGGGAYSNKVDVESISPPLSSNPPSNNLNVERQQRRFSNDSWSERENYGAQQTYKGDVSQNSGQIYNNPHRNDSNRHEGRSAAPNRKPIEGGGGAGGRGGFNSDALPQQSASLSNYRRRGGAVGREGNGQHNVNSAMYSKETRGGSGEDSRCNSYGGRPTNAPGANDYRGKVGNQYDYGGRAMEARLVAYESGYYTEGILADESEREERPEKQPRDMQRFHSEKNRRYSPYGGRSEDEGFEDGREFDVFPTKQNTRHRHTYSEEKEDINEGCRGRKKYRGGKGKRRRKGGRYDVDDIDVSVNKLWRNLHGYTRAESARYDDGLLPTGHAYFGKHQKAAHPPVTTDRKVRLNVYMELEKGSLALLNPDQGNSIPLELSTDVTLKDIAERVPEFVEFDRSTKDIEWVDVFGVRAWCFNQTMAPREKLQDFLRRENIADSTLVQLNVAFVPTSDWLQYRRRKFDLSSKKEKLEQVEKMRNVTLYNSYSNLKMFARGMNLDISNCGVSSLKSPEDIDHGGLNNFYNDFITKHYTLNVIKALWARKIGSIQKQLDMLDVGKQGANNLKVQIDLQMTALETERTRKRQKLIMNHHYSTSFYPGEYDGGQFGEGYHNRDDDSNAYIGDTYVYELHRKPKFSENGGQVEAPVDGYFDRGVVGGERGKLMHAFDMYDGRDLDMYDGRGETDAYDGAADPYEQNDEGGNGRRGGTGRGKGREGWGGGNPSGGRRQW